MKENAILKINKMGKVGYIISNILRILLILALAGTLVGAIATTVFPKDFMKVKWSGDARVEVSVSEISKLAGQTVTIAEIEKQLSALSENGSLNVDGKDYVYGEITLDDNGNIVVTGQAENPRTITMGDIRNITYAAAVYVALMIVTFHFICALCKAFRDCNSPFEENVIKKITNLAYALIPWVVVDCTFGSLMAFFVGSKDSLDFNLNIGMICTVLVIFGLAYVFKYGAVLQQESDETL